MLGGGPSTYIPGGRAGAPAPMQQPSTIPTLGGGPAMGGAQPISTIPTMNEPSSIPTLSQSPPRAEPSKMFDAQPPQPISNEPINTLTNAPRPMMGRGGPPGMGGPPGL